MRAERFLELTLTLGEGPVWDEQTRTLFFVDIEGQAIWSHAAETGQSEKTALGGRVGMCVPAAGGGLVAAVERRVLLLKDGKERELARVEDDLPDNRFNDGKCDARGRLLVGTMGTKGQAGQGGLYILEPGKPPRLLVSGVSVSNGLGFSPDNRFLYYVDTPSGSLWRFDYDLAQGTVSNRVPLIDYTGEAGRFDGLCVDSEGLIWAAHWGGSRVSRWNPESRRKVAEVMIPALYVTSCCFGGEDLGTLFVTSARGRDERDRAAWPEAGGLFALRPGVRGLPSTRCALPG